MRKRKLNGSLLVLAKLLDADINGVTMFKLQELTNIKNWATLNNAIRTLKELGFVVESLESGPPVRRIIRLTEKGREAAKHAKALLELAGLL